MSFPDQKPFTVTAAHRALPWNGVRDGRAFRCYLCGHPFRVGDTARWVFAGAARCRNFLTCSECDGPDVLERFARLTEELHQRYWWLMEPYPPLPKARKADGGGA